MELLRDRYSFHTSFDREVARFIKEELWYISPVIQDYTKLWNGKTNSYRLPDKKTIKLGVEQNLAPEVLFNTCLVELDGDSLQHAFVDCLSGLDRSLIPDIAGHTVLAGGNCLFQGFKERLLHEVTHLNKTYAKAVRFVESSISPQLSSWIGASMLSRINLDDMVTLEQYYELGARRLFS